VPLSTDITLKIAHFLDYLYLEYILTICSQTSHKSRLLFQVLNNPDVTKPAKLIFTYDPLDIINAYGIFTFRTLQRLDILITSLLFNIIGEAVPTEAMRAIEKQIWLFNKVAAQFALISSFRLYVDDFVFHLLAGVDVSDEPNRPFLEHYLIVQ